MSIYVISTHEKGGYRREEKKRIQFIRMGPNDDDNDTTRERKKKENDFSLFAPFLVFSNFHPFFSRWIRGKIFLFSKENVGFSFFFAAIELEFNPWESCESCGRGRWPESWQLLQQLMGRLDQYPPPLRQLHSEKGERHTILFSDSFIWQLNWIWFLPLMVPFYRLLSPWHR